MKRIISIGVALCCFTVLFSGWVLAEEEGKVISLQQEAEEQLQKELGAFDITAHQRDMAGHALQEGIGNRFDAEMDPENDTDAFLIAAVDYCVNTLELDKDTLLKELADAVIGDYYPSPSRVLPNIETILNAYLQSTLTV